MPSLKQTPVHTLSASAEKTFVGAALRTCTVTEVFPCFSIASFRRLRYNMPMKNTAVKKSGLAAIFALCPAAHILALSGGVVVLFFHALRANKPLMSVLSMNLVQPLHHALAGLTARLPFSLAEWLYALVIGGAIVYIIFELILLFCCPERLKRLYRLFVRLAALGLGVYALFCLLWGVYYYGDDFIARSGLKQSEITVDDLTLVTLWFADRLNDYAVQVPRDADGLCRSERAKLLSRSPQLFREAARTYPCLSGPELPAKGMFFSKCMSLIDFTGFFCPFTAEANVNMDFPEALFGATVAHELSHQRGVAKEQEANFVAVLASLSSGDPEYAYSACLLAYIHLGNALSSADPAAHRLIYAGLSDEVLADLRANSAYWARFETPVREVTDAVYEGFLQSYGQALGLRSYGACVDLLVNYYTPAAQARFAPLKPQQ